MISVDEARRIITGKTSALDPEMVSFEQSLGRALREAVIADTDQPPFDRSAMDGYAIRTDDSSESFKIAAVVQAGDVPTVSLRIGECARIFTGAQIPENSGVVIRQEDTTSDSQTMRVTARLPVTHIRKRGEDMKAGEILITPGKRLSPVDLSVIAGVGHTRVRVGRRPRVFHLSSGNELVSPDRTPGPGQIRDSNSILIRSLVEQAGAEIASELHAGDHPEEMINAIRGFASPYDVLLISGGASVGDFDYTASTLEHLGYDIHFRQVSVRPGKPLIFATNGAQIAFGLPGNPVSHFVTFHLFVRPALETMLGRSPPGPEFRSTHLACDFPEPSNPRETYAPARVLTDGTVEPITWQSSGHLASLVPATCLLRIPANTVPMKKGNPIQVFTV